MLPEAHLSVLPPTPAGSTAAAIVLCLCRRWIDAAPCWRLGSAPLPPRSPPRKPAL